MTDIASATSALPNRLGVTMELEEGELVLYLAPRPELLRLGAVRASVLAYAVDVVAGIVVDDDPSLWTLTSDMTVRMVAREAPGQIRAVTNVLRRGGRSMVCSVELTDERGTPVATGAIGFAKITRREGDPPKPQVSLERATEMFRGVEPLTEPLREAAGIAAIDPASGVVELLVTPELRNPVGTLQGAMVALVAEAAAEDLVSSRSGAPALVTDLDLRYLAQAREGPVRTSCRQLGEEPDAPVRVELRDVSCDRLTTLVFARAVAASPS